MKFPKVHSYSVLDELVYRPVYSPETGRLVGSTANVRHDSYIRRGRLEMRLSKFRSEHKAFIEQRSRVCLRICTATFD